jgi:hypothetical protein
MSQGVLLPGDVSYGSLLCDSPFAGTGSWAAIYRPTAANQFPCVEETIPEPDYFLGCQEESGDLTDAVNGAVFADGVSPSYQNTLTNWTTKWLGTDANTAAEGWRAEDTDAWDISQQSVFVLLYAAVTSSGGPRPLMIISSNGCRFVVQSTGKLSIIHGVNTTNGPTVDYRDAAGDFTPHPFTFFVDRRAAGAVVLNTDQEQITGVYSAVSDGHKSLGAAGALQSAGAFYNMVAVWVGSKAETMIDRGGAGLGGYTLIEDLGWELAY